MRDEQRYSSANERIGVVVMREIKFRVMLLDGTWHYFDCIRGIHGTTDSHFVPETVSQFTGLKDKNGVKIYEGDILRHDDYGVLDIWYGDGGYVMSDGNDEDGSEFDIDVLDEYHNDVLHNVTVIGNIHDNQELLKGETK